MEDLSLDEWQKEVLSTSGNIVLRSGRQVGKSTIISIKAAEFAAHHKNKKILVIACVERQAQLLFEKILAYMVAKYPKLIKKGRDRPTKHKLSLINGSVILCLPTGLSGYGIRGYTIDLLIADEAAFIPENVWTAVTPMMAVSRGNMILLSTPFGKGGFFYRCFSDPTFTSFHISSEECPRADHDFLAAEKARMSRLQYAQEYLGEFVDELRRFFSPELIRSCMKSSFSLQEGRIKNYLGVDVARLGGDESVLFSVAECGGSIYEIDKEILPECNLVDNYNYILHKDKVFNYSRIYIDDGGMGVGVFDMLLNNSSTKRKTIAINNSKRSLDAKAERKKALLKEDLYNNLRAMMEQGRVTLVESAETMRSLSCIQLDYTDKGNIKIFGSYTHITEALIRAAWCVREKGLNIYIDFS